MTEDLFLREDIKTVSGVVTEFFMATLAGEVVCRAEITRVLGSLIVILLDRILLVILLDRTLLVILLDRMLLLELKTKDIR